MKQFKEGQIVKATESTYYLEVGEIAEPDLEFKLKVLQKENEFLTRLLLKEGKL